MGKYYKDVADRIEKIIKLSPEYEGRVRYAQDLLDKYYEDWKVQYGSEAPPDPSQGRFPVKKSAVPVSGNIGKMSSRQGGGTTYSGFPINEMKNNLQIYIQRGMTEKARLVGVELYRIIELDDSSAKSNFTSFINTLKIITVEDVGIASFDLVIEIIDFLNKNPRPAFKDIDGIIIDLCEADKTHLSEQIWKSYTVDACIDNGIKRYGRSDNFEVDLLSYTDEDNKFIDDNFTNKVFNKNDSEDLRAYALVFYSRLFTGDYNAVTWWNFYMEYTSANRIEITPRDTYWDGETWKRVSKKDPTIILWDFISTVYEDNGSGPINTLRWAYFNNIKKASSRSYFLLAILATIYGIVFEGTELRATSDEDVKPLLTGDYELIMNETPISGKIRGKKSVTSSKLEPRSKTYEGTIYEDISSLCLDPKR